MSPLIEKKIGHPQREPTRLRLLIVGDQPRGRQSLEALFTALAWSTPGDTKARIDIVGEADDSRQAVIQIELLHPHVVVFDLPTQIPMNQVSSSGATSGATSESMASSTSAGLAAIRTIKQRWPSVRIVVLTMYAADRSAVLQAGADTFLLKGCPADDLLDAVIAAAP